TLLGVLIIIVMTWVIYLFIIQMFDPLDLTYYRQLRYNPSKELLIPARGAIYDCNGQLLASTIKYYQIDIDRGAVKKYCERHKLSQSTEFDKIAMIISRNSDLTKDFILEKLNRGNLTYSIQISNKIKESELNRILKEFAANKLPQPIYTFSSMKRVYSKGILAARVIGSVKENTEEIANIRRDKVLYQLHGTCGLEATYDRILSGDYGWREVVYDAHNSEVPYPSLSEKAPENGANLVLTIDSDIQEIVENNLFEGLEKYSAKNAAAVIMNPETGEVVAMAGISKTDKSTDPNAVRALLNIPVTFMFEPGSTFKPFTAMLALEKHLYRPTDLIDCSTRNIGGRIIRDSHGHPSMTLRNVIAYSSNCGISRVAEVVGQQALYNRLTALGFGQKSGLNLVGESSGYFRKLNAWGPYSLPSISFGQEVSVTPIQLAVAYCAIANGGKVMKPYIVKQITDTNGNVLQTFQPKVIRTVANKAVLDTLRSYMQSVVDYGTATQVKLDYLKVAGKTGTAEKKEEGSRYYSKDKFTSGFSGFFPADNPKLVMVVLYDEAVGVYHFGSLSAGPTFRAITEQICALPKCAIIPEVKQQNQIQVTMPNVTGLSQSQAESVLRNMGIKFNTVLNDPSGMVINQFPKAQVQFNRQNTATIVVDRKSQNLLAVSNNSIMPDLSGMTIRAAMKIAKIKRINLVVNGYGTIVSQTIPSGSRTRAGDTCTVEAR
ncbi:MAG TPA: penicillin-binding transpeptidase domain-containing protein, partial [Candidatus Cloacimonadota bacterium]|nr:penicillin-binding transpeptidase domain-containing protein [Candidatus Cloacimonadota bacterium]